VNAIHEVAGSQRSRAARIDQPNRSRTTSTYGRRRRRAGQARHTAACLAKVRQQTLTELAQHTTHNARALFRFGATSY
jgi:Tat protein secretion system quality control protein TatD with DNase activity